WENSEIRDEISSDLESGSPELTPGEVYDTKIRPLLLDYKNMLKDNNFKVEFEKDFSVDPEGPHGDGRVTGSGHVFLTVFSHKLPTGEEDFCLMIDIGLEYDSVSLGARLETGEVEVLETVESVEEFSKKHMESAIKEFNSIILENLE
ncbi:MAG: hypothetical protein V5A57_02940, partial [Candidatus Paceibacterota bacterium]